MAFMWRPADQFLDTLNESDRMVREEDEATLLGSSGKILAMALRARAKCAWCRAGASRHNAAVSAARCAPRSDASAREAAFRTSSVFTERSRRSAGGLESAAATGARASTSRKTALEEAMASRILERNLRLRLGGEERGEAVGDVGLEGVQGEELVVLGGVEGGHGGGAAAEAKHAEEAGGRRGIGGGHERSASVVAAIAEGVTVSYIQYIYTSTHAFSLPLTREPHHADGLVAGGGSFVVACHCGTC
jgi:hypothetical protein